MNKLKLLNIFYVSFLTILVSQIFIKTILFNCTFYDFGILFARQNFLLNNDYKSFFTGHVRIHEILINFFYSKLNNTLIYYFLVFFQTFIIVFTFFYLHKINKILSVIFLFNPISINSLFFDFHFEYLAVFFTAFFYFNSNKKYSLLLLLPIIFISELYAFLSTFFMWIYFRKYKISYFGLIFYIFILIYVYISIFVILDFTSEHGLYTKYNLQSISKIIYLIYCFLSILFFTNNISKSYFLKVKIFTLIFIINLFVIFLFLLATYHFKIINYINVNNHYLLIISFTSSLTIFKFIKKNKIWQYVCILFFFLLNPTVLGPQFYFNKYSNFYYLNYLNFNNNKFQNELSQSLSKIKSNNETILINNKFCNIEIFNLKKIFIYEDNIKLPNINYIFFTFHNYSETQKNEFSNFLIKFNIEYIIYNNKYAVGKIKNP